MKTAGLTSIALLLLLTGCSATWNGVKEDSTKAKDWTAEKINKSANYIKEKTE